MNILVISLAGNGDTLFATPLIHELRLNFPGATIDALVRWPAARDLLAGNPHLNRVHQKDLMKCGPVAAVHYLGGLRRRGYDLSINTHPQSRVHYRMVARMIGATTRFSHDYDGAGWLDRWLVNRSLPQDYTRHAVENNLAMLPLIGAKTLLSRHETELFLTAAEEAWTQEFLARHQLAGRKLLGIHVGSGGTKNLALRRWPLVNYIELVRRLRRDTPETGILFLADPMSRRIMNKFSPRWARRICIFPKRPGWCRPPICSNSARFF